MPRSRLSVLFLLVPFVLLPLAAGAQAQPGDSLATLRAEVRHEGEAVAGATVRSGGVGALTDARGLALLRLGVGEHAVVAARIGFVAETLHVVLRAGQDTTVAIALDAETRELETVLVTATRGERRLEDVPLRVEVLGAEEIEEKVLMTPGDIAMMLNETAGLRVQTTSPSLGGAGVRVQGLRGRYTLLIADGLPLHGGQAGGLGLLQIPPMDLGQVEVVKGAASALYGASALGGVINLVSRRPGEERERELLLNGTTRGGGDGVLWASGPLGGRWGYTLLGGAHTQARQDVDGDAWTDVPGYRRGVVRPRLFWDDGAGRSLFVTTGLTVEDREGGRTAAAQGIPLHRESLDTRRGDVGLVARQQLGANVLSLRGSALEQRHAHRFGDVRERDRHRTWFAEAALAVPRERLSWIVGAAFQHEGYAGEDVAAFDYAYDIPSLFVQADAEPAPWLSLSASARLDAHSAYGSVVHPRVSALVRAPDAGALAGWTARASLGTGAFAPTPFTEETEVVGLTPLDPLAELVLERATTASFDVTGPVGAVELVATAFGSVVRHPVAVMAAAGAPGRLRLVNAAEPTRTAGTELLARYMAEPWHVTASYTFTRSTELDVETGLRRDAPLVPRHAAGVVGMWEADGEGRVGVELYYTGVQQLDDDPFRDRSRPYLIVGALAERRIGAARLFVNLENIGDVRQTRWSPLVRPTPGPGGRRTTDAWTELAGRTINGGVRLAF